MSRCRPVMHEARADADAAPRLLALALSRALQRLAPLLRDSGQSALIDISHLGVVYSRPPACLAPSPHASYSIAVRRKSLAGPHDQSEAIAMAHCVALGWDVGS
jgi:hypothetical protein